MINQETSMVFIGNLNSFAIKSTAQTRRVNLELGGGVIKALTEEFKPSPKLKSIYWLYSLLYLIPATVIGLVLLFLNIWVDLAFLLVLVIAPVVVLAVWIPRFYDSVLFKVEEDHVYARFGVWWKKEKRVPYNLVSEVRLRQGPLQRRLRLVNIDVFTPATGAMKLELTLFQLDQDVGKEKLLLLRRRVGILSSKERRIIEEEILEELRKIRRILEEKLS